MKFREDLPDSGGGSFLKLKDRESVTGVFLGDVHEFFTLWQDGKSMIVPEGTPKAAFRFRINFIVKSGDGYAAKIFENGATVYRDLGALHEEYNLETVAVKLTRNGVGLETTYSLMPLLKTQINEAIRVTPLLQLDKDKAEAVTQATSSVDGVPF